MTHKEHEEYSGSQPSNVICVQKRGRERTEKDQRHNTANRANEHELASSESINIQGCPGVANYGERCPASVEKEGYGS